jgi:dsRNA-specific ribonuclease
LAKINFLYKLPTLDKELIAEGEGYSKQEAQTGAAAAALANKGW